MIHIFNINYLGHNFITPENHGIYHTCSVCNIYMLYSQGQYLYRGNGKLVIFNIPLLTCEEQQIKNIIE